MHANMHVYLIFISIFIKTVFLVKNQILTTLSLATFWILRTQTFYYYRIHSIRSFAGCTRMILKTTPRFIHILLLTLKR